MIPNDMWHQSLPTTFLYLSRQIVIIIIIIIIIIIYYPH